MGLCKCPKRRVTNMFCFEHRVNVCEHCVATNHTKCIIQSYLQWLQDSDYNPICELCMKELKLDDCIRLTCYHIFHWGCLDRYARELPSTTAPAGYTCPSCKSALFPPNNLIGPVVNVLREHLAGVNWARAGLGLPLLSEDREVKPTAIHSAAVVSNSIMSPLSPSHSVVHMDNEQGVFNRESSETYQAPARRVYQDIRETRGVVFDHDDDKYKRRPPSEWVRRWWKNALGSQQRGRSASIYKRYCMLGILIVFAIIVLLAIMSRLGRYSVENDPNLELLQNPHVHVEQQRSM